MNAKAKPKYSAISNIFFSLRYIWRCARDVILFGLLLYPVGLMRKLAEMYFPKLLIDGITAGQTAVRIALTIAGFQGAILLIRMFQEWCISHTNRYHYYITGVVQSQLSQKNMRGDFQKTNDPQITLKRDKIGGDASGGQCAIEFLERDLNQVVSSILEMGSCAAIISFISPWILLTVCVETAVYYFFSKANMKYARDHADANADANRRRNYISGFSQDFSYAKAGKPESVSKRAEPLVRPGRHRVIPKRLPKRRLLFFPDQNVIRRPNYPRGFCVPVFGGGRSCGRFQPGVPADECSE